MTVTFLNLSILIRSQTNSVQHTWTFICGAFRFTYTTTSIHSCLSCTTIIWKKFTIINNKPLQDIKQLHLKMTIAHIFLTHANFTSQKWMRINRSNGQWIWGLSHFVIVWILQKRNKCYRHMIMPYINIDKFSICMLSYLLKQLEHTVLNFDSYSMFNYILFFISFMKIINVSLGMMNLYLDKINLFHSAQ